MEGRKRSLIGKALLSSVTQDLNLSHICPLFIYQVIVVDIKNGYIISVMEHEV